MGVPKRGGCSDPPLKKFFSEFFPKLYFGVCLTRIRKEKIWTPKEILGTLHVTLLMKKLNLSQVAARASFDAGVNLKIFKGGVE